VGADMSIGLENHFAVLVDALGMHIGVDIHPVDGSVVLVDDAGRVRLVVEQALSNEAICLIAPFMPFPDMESFEFGYVAGQLLQLNADRAAMNGAVVCADALRQEFCLVCELRVEIPAVDFIGAAEALGLLACSLRDTLNKVHLGAYRFSP